MSQHRQKTKFARYRNHHLRAKMGLFEGNNLWCDGPGVVQHLSTPQNPLQRRRCPSAFLGLRLLFAGVLRKSLVSIATAGSVARVASQGTLRGQGTFRPGCGLSSQTETAAGALPALTPQTLHSGQPGGCTWLAPFLPSVDNVAKVCVPVGSRDAISHHYCTSCTQSSSSGRCSPSLFVRLGQGGEMSRW